MREESEVQGWLYIDCSFEENPFYDGVDAWCLKWARKRLQDYLTTEQRPVGFVILNSANEIVYTTKTQGGTWESGLKYSLSISLPSRAHTRPLKWFPHRLVFILADRGYLLLLFQRVHKLTARGFVSQKGFYITIDPYFDDSLTPHTQTVAFPEANWNENPNEDLSLSCVAGGCLCLRYADDKGTVLSKCTLPIRGTTERGSRLLMCRWQLTTIFHSLFYFNFIGHNTLAGYDEHPSSGSVNASWADQQYQYYTGNMYEGDYNSVTLSATCYNTYTYEQSAAGSQYYDMSTSNPKLEPLLCNRFAYVTEQEGVGTIQRRSYRYTRDGEERVNTDYGYEFEFMSMGKNMNFVIPEEAIFWGYYYCYTITQVVAHNFLVQNLFPYMEDNVGDSQGMTFLVIRAMLFLILL